VAARVKVACGASASGLDQQPGNATHRPWPEELAENLMVWSELKALEKEIWGQALKLSADGRNGEDLSDLLWKLVEAANGVAPHEEEEPGGNPGIHAGDGVDSVDMSKLASLQSSTQAMLEQLACEELLQNELWQRRHEQLEKAKAALATHALRRPPPSRRAVTEPASSRSSLRQGRLDQKPEVTVVGAAAEVLTNFVAEVEAEESSPTPPPWGRIITRLQSELASQRERTEALRTSVAASHMTTSPAAVEARLAKSAGLATEKLCKLQRRILELQKALTPLASWLCKVLDNPPGSKANMSTAEADRSGPGQPPYQADKIDALLRSMLPENAKVAVEVASVASDMQLARPTSPSPCDTAGATEAATHTVLKDDECGQMSTGQRQSSVKIAAQSVDTRYLPFVRGVLRIM